MYAHPTGDFTLQFDCHAKHCIGWYDMRTGECHQCSAQRETADKYEQCPECQQKTGFNPAFYNTTNLSQQQAELNAQPHIVYLAYFAPDVMKVGISYAGRHLARLLEQGARSAIILDTFPSANVARQYEARISQMPNICESVQLRKKITLFTERRYDQTTAHQALMDTVACVEAQLQVTFMQREYVELSSNMLLNPQLDSTAATEITEPKISGHFAGMVGSLLIMQHDDRLVFMPLKYYVGYDFTISRVIEPLALAPMQTSLF